MPEPISAIQVSPEDQLPNNLLSKVELLIKIMIQEHELLPESIYLAQTKSSEDAKTKNVSFFIYTSEAPFPCRKDEPKSNYVEKSLISFEYKKKSDSIVVTSSYDVTDAIAIHFNLKQDKMGYHYSFPASTELIDTFKSIIEFKLKNYVSAATTFGCCSKFTACSDARKCVHENKLYSTSCIYRHHLEEGRIFYGKNKNIDDQGKLIKIEETHQESSAINPFVTSNGSSISIGLSLGNNESDVPIGRTNKGSSIILFPDQYVIVDIETTGLSPEWDDIIEVSGVRYNKDFEEIDHFSELVQPEGVPLPEGGYHYVSEFITDLTGITNEMLANARPTKEVIPEFLNYLGDSFIIGYNVNFDINFLYDNAEYLELPPFSNDFMDVMRLSRKLYPDMKHHRLADMANVYSVDYTNAHRSLKDCYITAEVYRNLYNLALMTYGTEDEVIKQFRRHHKSKLKASDIVANVDPESIDKDNSLYGKTIVFTGALERFERKAAMQLVTNLGGIPADSVTKKTDFLVLGNNDYCSTIKDGKSSKQKKAEELKLAGSDIEIIPEKVFYDMIEDGE